LVTKFCDSLKSIQGDNSFLCPLPRHHWLPHHKCHCCLCCCWWWWWWCWLLFDRFDKASQAAA